MFLPMFQVAAMSKNNNNNNTPDEPGKKEDLVAKWYVPLFDSDHVIEFEHGTTTGKRVVTVDGKEIVRREWMFRLVGDECFSLPPKYNCIIRVNPRPAFSYSYEFYVNGVDIDEFIKRQRKSMIVWIIISPFDERRRKTRIALDKTCLDLWIDGEKADTEDEFTDNGTKKRFVLNGDENDEGFILGQPTGDKHNLMQYQLFYKDKIVQPLEIL